MKFRRMIVAGLSILAAAPLLGDGKQSLGSLVNEAESVLLGRVTDVTLHPVGAIATVRVDRVLAGGYGSPEIRVFVFGETHADSDRLSPGENLIIGVRFPGEKDYLAPRLPPGTAVLCAGATLRGEDLDEGERSVHRLLALGPEGPGPWGPEHRADALSLLADRHPQVRLEALRRLKPRTAGLDENEVALFLERFRRERSEAVLRSYMDGFLCFRPRGFAEAVAEKVLDAPSEPVADLGIRALAGAQDPSAAAILVVATRSGDPTLRRRALLGLGAVGIPETMPLLEDGLWDPETWDAAIDGLGMMNTRPAIGMLEGIATRTGPSVACRALLAIAQQRTPEAVRAIRACRRTARSTAARRLALELLTLPGRR